MKRPLVDPPTSEDVPISQDIHVDHAADDDRERAAKRVKGAAGVGVGTSTRKFGETFAGNSCETFARKSAGTFAATSAEKGGG
ncbi:unnamed protein product [Linum trigynum]|uniref:Uncharacterized protein n=1 Tax=Linum trigynum TaxID=586398 RepID=A0AAV2F8M4_9ROSI